MESLEAIEDLVSGAQLFSNEAFFTVFLRTGVYEETVARSFSLITVLLVCCLVKKEKEKKKRNYRFRVT